MNNPSKDTALRAADAGDPNVDRSSVPVLYFHVSIYIAKIKWGYPVVVAPSLLVYQIALIVVASCLSPLRTLSPFTDRQVAVHQVKDSNNCKFLLRILARLGLMVPPTIFGEKALVEVAQCHNLLGHGATEAELEACFGGNALFPKCLFPPTLSLF